MKASRIVQVVVSLQQGDAIGNETFALHEIFKSHSIPNEIVFLENKGKVFDTKYIRTGKQVDGFKFLESDLIIIHESMGNKKLHEIRNLPNAKINRYHNITPGKYFQRYRADLAHLGLDQGRRDIMAASKNYSLAIADSNFNAQELLAGGYTKIKVIPVFIPFQRFSKVKELANHTQHKKRKTKRILFVGRLVPNKKVEDLIRLFQLYHSVVNKNSELLIVGQPHFDLYFAELTSLVQTYKLEEKVIFKRFVSDKELAKLYSESDVFITMSEHEGFCVPVVEAMYMGLPVMARSDTATGETLGESGIKIKSLDYDMIAETINEVVNNNDFRQALVDTQFLRLKEFEHEKIEQQWLKAIAEF